MRRTLFLTTGALLTVCLGGCTNATPGRTTVNQPRRIYHADSAMIGTNIPYASSDPIPTPNPDADAAGVQIDPHPFIGNMPGDRGVGVGH